MPASLYNQAIVHHGHTLDGIGQIIKQPPTHQTQQGGDQMMDGRHRKVYAVFGTYASLGAAVFLAGLRPSVMLVSIAVFLAFFSLPTVMSASQAIIQTKVAPTLQERVFGLRIFVIT